MQQLLVWQVSGNSVIVFAKDTASACAHRACDTIELLGQETHDFILSDQRRPIRPCSPDLNGLDYNAIKNLKASGSYAQDASIDKTQGSAATDFWRGGLGFIRRSFLNAIVKELLELIYIYH